MMQLPIGTITFLFTDIEGSTSLWEQHPEIMRLALARHDALMREAIESRGGHYVKSTGDGTMAAFPIAAKALSAAVDAQRALQAEQWPYPLEIRVRMALHSGPADVRDGDYFGQSVNRVARLMQAGNGGQILLSQSAFELCESDLPEGGALHRLGPQRLKGLAQSEPVYLFHHSDLRRNDAPLRSVSSVPNNLPHVLTSFIGRENVLTEITALLRKTRLLTLLGTGGIGKTRLSLQAAAGALDAFEDGVWLIELAPLAEAELLPQTAAAALGLKDQTGRTIQQTLASYLKDREALLILDNCEHLVYACAQFASAMLRSCPQVRILATSRERLGIAGETAYRVPSLSLPDSGLIESATVEKLMPYEAVRLFVERAQQVNAAFAVTDQNAGALAQICRRLDGIPLALELAAARARSLSPLEINSRLDSRFKLLTGGDRAALPRQQTLRALIDWSYDLLSEPERLLFARLSVFAGGWSRCAAEAVCGSPPIDYSDLGDLLTSLCDKSLILAGADQDTTRYSMLESLRHYAGEKLLGLGESETLRRRHADWCLALAVEAEPYLSGGEQVAWLARLDAEHDNLRAALAFCAGDAEGILPGLRLASSLWRFWDVRGFVREGRDHLRLALERARQALCEPASGSGALEGGLKTSFAVALSAAGNLAWSQGDYSAAQSCHEESLIIRRELDDRSGIAASLGNLSNVSRARGDYATAREQLQESLLIRREQGDTSGIAWSLGNLGVLTFFAGDYPAARELYEESLSLQRELGNRSGIATMVSSIGDLLVMEGDLASARVYYDECFALYQEMGHRKGIASSLSNLGVIAQAEGDLSAARSYFDSSLKMYRELEDKHGMVTTLTNLGLVASSRGEYASARTIMRESLVFQREVEAKRMTAYTLESLAQLHSLASEPIRAATLWGAANSIRSAIGSPLTPAEEAGEAERIAAVRQSLGEEAFSFAWQHGASLSWERAIDAALSEA